MFSLVGRRKRFGVGRRVGKVSGKVRRWDRDWFGGWREGGEGGSGDGEGGGGGGGRSGWSREGVVAESVVFVGEDEEGRWVAVHGGKPGKAEMGVCSNL